MVGAAPNDDSKAFLQLSGVYPPLAAAGAAIIYSFGWWLFFRKIDGLQRVIKVLNSSGKEWGDLAVRWTGAVAAALGALALFASFALNGFSTTPRPPQAPHGYTLQNTIQLSKTDDFHGPVLTFQLDQPKAVSIFLARANMDGDWFEARVIGSEGYDRHLISSEKTKSPSDSVTFQDILDKGTYNLVITSPGTSGTISIYTQGIP